MADLPDDDKLKEELTDLFAKEAMIDRAKLVPDATLESIGVASYDMVMVLMAIEEKYNVYISVDAELSEAKTLEALLNQLVVRIKAGPTEQPAPPAGQAPAETP